MANTWSAAGSLAIARSEHTATLLPSLSKVLVAGGYHGSYVAGAELYNPATNTWAITASLATARGNHTATLLQSGKVLVAGGFNGGYLASAELYDAQTGTWSAAGTLATARASHTATALPSGKVLVVGGSNGSGFLASAELYDPATNTWAAAGTLATARANHTATLLSGGKVLVVGGSNSSGASASAEIYDLATNTWVPASALATARGNHTATALPSGKVLVAGGIGSGGVFLASAELYDATTDTWVATGALATARGYHTATLLGSGKVLVAGGQGSSGVLASAELYDPATTTWAAAGALATARGFHTATLLPTGKVLAAGGSNGGSFFASAELYDPGVTSTTSLNSSTNPSPFTQSVSFTASVIGQSPTGTVTFNDGATAICSAVTLSSGSASCATSTLTLGAHLITAVYSGDANNAPSTSNTVAQQVNSTVLVSATNPSTYSQNVVFTVTVYGNSPGGAVFFFDGATTISFCQPVFLSGGSVSCPTSDLSVGSHAIKAMYLGDFNNPAATSNIVTQQVNPAPTSSTLSSATNPSTYEQGVTFTATVSGYFPSGTVTFNDGATSICSAVTLTSGNASCPTSTLSAGSHSITAVYNGDTNNAASTSNIVMQQVSQISSSSALSSATNPSALGQSVTFTAAVSGQSPTGTVTFSDGATTICLAVTLNSGNASCLTSALSLGSHSITAVYSGDVNYATSTSNSVTQQVDPAPTSTTLGSATNPSTFGQSVTFTAALTAQFSPTGTVMFKDGAITICAAATLSSGSASCPTSALSVGTHSITAVYSGDTNNATSTSNTVMQQVNQVTSSSALSSATSPSTFGQGVTFTAIVSGILPTGTVAFSDGATTICPAATLNSGSASCPTSTLSVGSHSITAVYSGDTNNTTSTSNTVTQQVNQATSSTTLTSSYNPAKFGASVPFTASVTGQSPTGTVTFNDGATPICTAVTLSSGSAACATSTLSLGAHSITAVYSGDTNNATSTSATLTQQVYKNPTTTSLATNCMTTFVENQPFTMTASVSGAAPTGDVSFATQDNVVVCANVPLSSGSASCATNALSVAGSATEQGYSLTANYGSDAANAPSTSAAIMVMVLKASDVVFRNGLEVDLASCPIE